MNNYIFALYISSKNKIIIDITIMIIDEDEIDCLLKNIII